MIKFKLVKRNKNITRNTNNERAAWDKSCKGERLRERERESAAERHSQGSESVMRSRYFPTVVGGTFRCGRQNFNTPNSRPAAAAAAAAAKAVAAAAAVRGASEQWTVFGPSQSAPSSSAKHKHTRHTQPLGVCSLYVTGALRCAAATHREEFSHFHTQYTNRKWKVQRKKEQCTRKEENFENSCENSCGRIRIVCENFPQE